MIQYSMKGSIYVRLKTDRKLPV